jgi:ribosomal protein S1
MMNFQAQDTEPEHEQDMGELLDSMEAVKPLRRGDVVEGVIMSADTNGIFVNIGHKSEGIVPPAEMKTLNPEELEALTVGKPIITLVVRPETPEQGAILSIDRAVGEHGWRTLQKALESGESVEGRIIGFNRGGAIVEVEGVQGFVPMSQLVTVSRERFRTPEEVPPAEPSPQEVAPAQPTSDEPAPAEPTAEAGAPTEAASEETTPAEPTAEAAAPIEATSIEATSEETTPAEPTAEAAAPIEATSEETTPAEPTAEEAAPDAGAQEAEATAPEPPSDIDKILQLKVLEVIRSRNRAIFSERRAIQEQRDAQKARLIQELTEGEVRSGKVTGISSFGAFVDLGGADGLIHISELSWNQVNSPEEIVKVGEELDVYVLRVDAENTKIALSLKRLQREPWETVEERYSVGDIVDATVTKLTNFGAFARVEGSVEGLIHISELTPRMISHPREVVREGDAVKLKILRIEPERRRLGLSLKQVEEEYA